MTAETKEKTPCIIFGTDWWTDCDDVAALDILLGAHKRGRIDLKAIGVSSVMRYSAPSVKALCEQHGLDGIPIGIDKGARRKGFFCMYQKKLASYCKSGFTNGDCPEAYKLYRSVLSSVPEKALIVDVGFPQIILELLQSGADEYSESSGMQLVEDKVSEIILMGGRWDKNPGREYNFCAYRANREAAAYICRHSPVPLTFLGYEAGKDVITAGKGVYGLTGIAYAAHCSSGGRPSWDPMTAVYAIIGDADKAGYKKVWGRVEVDPKTGKNRFEANANGKHSYLVKEKEDAFYKSQIERLLTQAP